jgi:hypothetical protein
LRLRLACMLPAYVVVGSSNVCNVHEVFTPQLIVLFIPQKV